MEWAGRNIEKILAAAGALILIAAAASGFFYYRHASLENEYTALYEAVILAADEGAGEAAVDEAANRLKRLLESGPSKAVETQARLWLGDLLIRKEEPSRAAAEYERMAKAAGKGTLAHELALAREADALLKAGKPGQAADRLRTLSESAESYPRSTALYDTAMALAAAGDREKAVGAIEKLMADYPSFHSPDFLEATIRRIRSGALSAEASPSGKLTPEKPEAMPVGASDVHGGEG